MLKKINWHYALGEIIIVIIGITIAFALNRWGENAKERAGRTEYLQSLLIDLESEQQHLQENMERFQAKRKTIEQLFPILAGRKEGRDTMAFKIFRLAEIVYFQPNDVTYRTLTNSGDLGLFDDFKLRKALEAHYANHQVIRLDYERQNNINEKYFADFMIHKVNFQAIRRGNYDFIDDPLLANIVQSLYGTYDIATKTSEAGIARCTALKKRLEELLK